MSDAKHAPKFHPVADKNRATVAKCGAMSAAQHSWQVGRTQASSALSPENYGIILAAFGTHGSEKVPHLPPHSSLHRQPKAPSKPVLYRYLVVPDNSHKAVGAGDGHRSPHRHASPGAGLVLPRTACYAGCLAPTRAIVFVRKQVTYFCSHAPTMLERNGA